MKLKNKLSTVVISVLSLSCASGLTSCDGGSGGDDVIPGSIGIELPNDPDAANGINAGDDADNSGADSNLEITYAKDIFDSINSVRVGNGSSALIRNSVMDNLAAAHNANMISQASPGADISVNHDNAQSRATTVSQNGFNSFGENTGGIRGYTSSRVANEFVNGWVTSPGHFRNIVGDFSHSGIAVTVDSRDGTIYSTQIFAK